MFLSLDFLYVPAPDVKESVRYYTDILKGKLVFDISAMGTRVAAVRIADHGPLVLLAGHLEKGRLIHIYRVSNLKESSAAMKRSGWKAEHTIELPPGPCTTFRDPAGNVLAIYEAVRDFMKEFPVERE